MAEKHVHTSKTPTHCYARAARLIDLLEEAGVIGSRWAKPRDFKIKDRSDGAATTNDEIRQQRD